jgi:hypothetical protein
MQFRRGKEGPTCVEIRSSSVVTSDECEKIVSSFIDNGSTTNPLTINQLKRLQRDLRGLPPLLQSVTPNEDVVTDLSQHEPSGRESFSRPLSKEERRKLKKERRKHEKKAKLEAKQDHKDEDQDENDDEDNKDKMSE